MQAQAQDSIFHPHDTTLASRINAYQTVLQEKRNIELSLDLLNSREWSERLGSAEELQQAHKVLSSSLEKAVNSFSVEDLKTAKEEKLLDESQLHELHITKAQAQLHTQRNSQNSYSIQHSKSNK